MTTTAAADEVSLKQEVEAFWNAASCGEVYMEGPSLRARLDAQASARYALEPFIFDFANFSSGARQRVLEIGVGMGADHLEWAKARPATLIGIDLTQRALNFTKSRFMLHGFEPQVTNADAERLPFRDAEFDVVYSWGVIHHSPDTARIVAEIKRVLRPRGVAKVMIYHSRSIVGYMLWLRYAVLRGRPGTTMKQIYATHLESPGTKAYSIAEARELFGTFSSVKTAVELSAGDLMEGEAGQRHQGLMLRAARRVWPRQMIRKFLRHRGLFLMIEAVK